VRDRGHFSGDLHRAERSLSGVGTPEYREKLLKAFSEAEAVLVVNPLAEAMVAPYCKRALVVTAGMDPERFPWPPLPDADPPRTPGKLRVLFAGLTGEWMKGFHVLRSACARLWESRQDFELAVTGDSPDPPEPFARYVGWKTQAELPRLIRSCDVLAVPTVAQDALGRTAVEAMAAGVPVVASNLGGLPFTVADGATGLLFEPGDSADLAAKLSALLDDPDLRRRMGEAGRRRFEERYAWPVIIEKHYRPLLKPREARVVRVPAPPAPYAPYIPDRVDQERLKADIASCLGLRAARVDQLYRDYRSLHEREGYAERLGELKTLCFEEAFALHCVLAARRPATLVEVGTQQGKSARRLLDMQSALGLTSPLVCFDVADQVQHFRKDEARLVLCDLTGRFRSAVLDAFEPGLVFLDVHAHALLTEAVREVLADRRGWALAVHDCGRGLCNPRMAIAPEGPNVTSHTGVWERHVLAQAFGVPDPLDPRLDCATTATHRLTVLDTPHGLGLVLPR
jgi:hypothetical protein